MEILRKGRNLTKRAIKRALLGEASPSHKYHLALRDPQSEVDVWLNGFGDPIEVTHCHLMACGAPLTICIGFTPSEAWEVQSCVALALRFQEHAGFRRVLGEISLKFVSSLHVGTRELCLFHVVGSVNWSLPRYLLWAYQLEQDRGARPPQNDDVPITVADSRAMEVFYLCPRPTALVTVGDQRQGNLFPMNLMGYIGDDYFAFGLNSSRSAPQVERAGRVVLSSFPMDRLHLLPDLGKNHRRESIDWTQLPFPVLGLRSIHAPVPSFTLMAQEMQILQHCHLGSHTLFVARIVAQEFRSDGPRLYMAHGMYKAHKQLLA
jgi:flavin reductase (DIM6/NTAB) family NADH-FMN oxidoreductase RutF